MNSKESSYLVLKPVEWAPHASHTLVQTLDRPAVPLQFLAARVLEQLDFLLDLIGHHVPHRDGFLSSIHIGASDERVSAGSWRDSHLDGGILTSEVLEVVLEVGIHAPTAAGPVTVVEVQPFTLENERAHPVLIVLAPR